MRPQDIVALMLTFGVLLVLFSGTNISRLWIDAAEYAQWRETRTPESFAFWKDIINVILGALAGYIAGRGAPPGPPAPPKQEDKDE